MFERTGLCLTELPRSLAWAWNPSAYGDEVTGAHCPPSGAADNAKTYTIGRTMIEGYPPHEEFVRRCNAMDEIWVPSKLQLDNFAKAGVAKEKLVSGEVNCGDIFCVVRARPPPPLSRLPHLSGVPLPVHPLPSH
jgi:hypothetical protein